MADVVGQDDVVASGVQRLAGPEEFVGELRLRELLPGTAGAVQDEHRVGDLAAGIAMGRPDGGVVQTQFGE